MCISLMKYCILTRIDEIVSTDCLNECDLKIASKISSLIYDNILPEPNHSDFNILYYVTRYVSRSISRRTKYESCINILKHDDIIDINALSY